MFKIFFQLNHPELYIALFFSRRRRHTRSTRDWSSDVCSSDLPGACRTRPSFAPVNAMGPQSWYGEIESYGSGTETRYGTAVPQMSCEEAVRPPEVEKKYVFATWPL